MAVAIVAGVYALFYYANKSYQRERAYCESRGGVYISRESMCIKDERIPLQR